MGKFMRKKLFEITTGKTSGTTETMWAYSVSTESTTSTGRYRIRISRMTAAEMIEALGANPEDVPTDLTAHTVQAYLEKWHDTGWIPCLDWLGAPSSDNYQIETDLSDMFQAFITGSPTYIESLPDFPPPKSYPKKNYKEIEKPPPTPPETPTSGSDTPDFDWI
jgi:hypothetical protein